MSGDRSGRRVLLGVSGGIAAYKAAALASELVQRGDDVCVVMTASAERFVGAATFAALTRRRVFTSLWDEPEAIPHIALVREAGVLAIVPATANVLAKLARGIADDLLTNAALAARIPIVVAPAMNAAMYEHPATVENLRLLRSRGVTVRRARRRLLGRTRGGDRPPRGPAPDRRRHRRRAGAFQRACRTSRGRHRGADARADRPRSLHLQRVDGDDGHRTRARGARARRRGRPRAGPDPGRAAGRRARAPRRDRAADVRRDARRRGGRRSSRSPPRPSPTGARPRRSRARSRRTRAPTRSRSRARRTSSPNSAPAKTARSSSASPRRRRTSKPTRGRSCGANIWTRSR